MCQISPVMVFSSEKELFSWTYLRKKTPRRTKILISLVWNKILKIWDILFELINIEVKFRKNLFKIFLQQEGGAFENNIGREPQKPRPKLQNIYIKYLLRILALPIIQCKWQLFANMYYICSDSNFLNLKVA